MNASDIPEIPGEVERLENAIAKFYYDLAKDQKRLPYEFEKVLFDNLWDLYEGSRE